jgi:hypothetical protein
MDIENHCGKLLILPSEFSGNPTRGHLVANQEELEKEMMYFHYDVSLSYF